VTNVELVQIAASANQALTGASQMLQQPPCRRTLTPSLHRGIQIDEGAQRGGVAGWLDRDGRPEFVYLEIVGYYLTAIGSRVSIAPPAASPHADFFAARSGREAG
jgi:hypothetical protein